MTGKGLRSAAACLTALQRASGRPLVSAAVIGWFNEKSTLGQVIYDYDCEELLTGALPMVAMAERAANWPNGSYAFTQTLLH